MFRARPAAGSDPASAAPRSPEIREVRWFAADELPALQHEAVSALMALASSALGDEATVAGEGPSVTAETAGVSGDGAACGGPRRRRPDQLDPLAS